MSARIYIGNLAFTTDDDGIAGLCGEYGTVVSATVARDQFSSRSRGFGFVEFESDAQAAAAIEGLNGFELDGRTLRVELEKPKTVEERTEQRERRRRELKERRAAAIAAAESGESKVELTLRVYVGNLPYETTAEGLGDLFKDCAGYVSVELASDTNRKGFGYVTFDNEDNLRAAISAKAGSTLGGRTLDVQREMPKPAGGRRRRARRGRGRRSDGAGAGAGGAGAGSDDAAPQAAAAPIENNPAKIYIGNVPFSLTEDALSELFAEFGSIAEVSIPKASSGRRLGFAYVTFDDAAAASAAVEARNETDIGGRTVRVELENRKPKRSRRRRRRKPVEETDE